MRGWPAVSSASSSPLRQPPGFGDARRVGGHRDDDHRLSHLPEAVQTAGLSANKILLVSLAGLLTETASLLGTLLVNALWTAAQTISSEKANFLYLDEFQLKTRLPMGWTTR